MADEQQVLHERRKESIAGLQAAFREILGLSLPGLAYYGPLTPEHLLAVEQGRLEQMDGLYRQYGYNLGRAWVMCGQPEKASSLVREIEENLTPDQRVLFQNGYRMGVRSGQRSRG